MRLTTFIKGISIGFILGVLFAPDRGSATRRKLAGVASDIKDDMEDVYDNISDTVSETIDSIKTTASNIAGRVEQDFSDVTTLGEERF